MYSMLWILFVLILAVLGGMWLGRLTGSPGSWSRDDLRAIDPADDLPDPSVDITAVYTRIAGLHCEIRIDLLDLPETPQYDIEILVDGHTLKARAGSPLPPGLTLEYDSVLDSIVFDLDGCAPRASVPLLVRTYTPAASAPADEVRVLFGAALPKAQVEVRFAFYNVFSPAATPAQALRRWDGAHTGPRGERHGLHDLLNAAEKYHIPLTLLDLKTPATLSAIDYLGGMRQVRRMEQDGMLDLPAVVYAEPQDISLAFSRAAADGFGLRLSTAYYDALHPAADLPPNLLLVDPGDDGLPLAVRRTLLDAALSGATLTLGGDFQQTTWGTPNYVNLAFAYLAARPYIGFKTAPVPNLDNLQPAALPGPIERSAFEARFDRAAADPALAENYRGVEAGLRAASMWAQKPRVSAACADVCILSSEKFYAVLEPRGGRLAFFFAGEDQVIGPTAQFFIGFSDRSEWDPAKGEAADPAQVMGAFADAQDVFRQYTPEILDEKTIRFKAPDGSLKTKTYRLTDSGLEVQLSGPLQMKIPLVVSPQSRFESGWAERYTLKRESGRAGLGLASGPMVWITALGASDLSLESALDVEARPLLLSPEDPDKEYPSSIYLPFALAMVHLSSTADVFVSITVAEK